MRIFRGKCVFLGIICVFLGVICVFLGVILQTFSGGMPPDPLEWSAQGWFVTTHDCDETCPTRKFSAYATGHGLGPRTTPSYGDSLLT